MGTVSPSSLLGGTVHLGMGNVKALRVHPLHLRIALRVGQQIQHHLRRLLGPGALRPRDAQKLGLCVTAHTTVETSERDRTLVLEDILKEGLGLADLPALDGVCHFADVLEMHAEVGATGLGDCFLM